MTNKTIAIYEGKKYEIPMHEWILSAADYVLTDKAGNHLGKVIPYSGAYRTISGNREFAISETLEWAKAVVLLETFHPGSIGEGAWY